ncbi:MAG: glycosyltransferase family 39 protein [Chloroflexi bacterium]|nr:glycosyltransferase family 39 protein [Chloroflexota bacterium]
MELPTFNKNHSRLLLIGILLLAAALRIHDLGTRSLWEDEGWTLVLSKGPTIPAIVQRMAFDQHPPLYFVAIHLWREVAGSTEFGLRMLSVLTGIIAVAGIYQLGKSMFGTTAGILAALFLALSDHHIDLSQDVRHYAQMATFIVLSCWFYFRLIKTDAPSRGTRIGYVLLSTALLYSHYLGGFVFVCQILHLCLFVRPFHRLRWAIFHLIAVGIAFAPWLPVMYRQNQVRWVTPLYYLNALPNTYATYLMVRDALFGKQYAITLFLLTLGLVWICYQQGLTKLKFHPLGPTFFAVFWLVAYTGITVYMNQERQFLTVRNFLVVTPAIALLVGHGLANLQSNLRLFLVGVFIVMSLTTIDTRQLKPPWREVTHNITEFHNPGEPVLMDIWVGDFSVRYYVEQQMGQNTPWLSIRETADQYNTQFLPYLLTYVRDLDAFWLVYWGDEPSKYGDYFGIFEQAGFQRTAAPYVVHEGAKLYSYRYDRLTDDVFTTYHDDTQAVFALRKFAVQGDLNPGETITATLWWTAEVQPPLDYSVSVFVLNTATGQLVAQHDGPPLDGKAQTSTWTPGHFQYDQHQLALPDDLPPGSYTLGVKVYYYAAQNSPLQTDCSKQSAASCDWATLQQFTIN